MKNYYIYHITEELDEIFINLFFFLKKFNLKFVFFFKKQINFFNL